jgi:hypothetical protein
LADGAQKGTAHAFPVREAVFDGGFLLAAPWPA